MTVERYAAAVEAGTVPAPPDSCGVRFIQAVGPYMELASADEVSGWTAGEPYPARLEHPVVCVTREEAQAYCESQGGRLPRAAELMKAARGDGEGPRRFPWGDSPPEPGAHRGLIYAGTPDGWWLAYANIGLWRGEVDVALGTRPADSAADGASPYGVLGLSGNVTELAGAGFWRAAELPRAVSARRLGVRAALGAPSKNEIRRVSRSSGDRREGRCLRRCSPRSSLPDLRASVRRSDRRCRWCDRSERPTGCA